MRRFLPGKSLLSAGWGQEPQVIGPGLLLAMCSPHSFIQQAFTSIHSTIIHSFNKPFIRPTSIHSFFQQSFFQQAFIRSFNKHSFVHYNSIIHSFNKHLNTIPVCQALLLRQTAVNKTDKSLHSVYGRETEETRKASCHTAGHGMGENKQGRGAWGWQNGVGRMKASPQPACSNPRNCR